VVANPSHIRAALAHAIETTEYVNQKTDLEVSLFEVLQGEPLGTLTFAYTAESYAASLASADELSSWNEYFAKIEEGAELFVGNPVDQVNRFVHTAGEVSEPPAAATTVTATIELPQIAEAMSWALEFANYTSNLTGVPIQLISSSFGQYGAISWIFCAQSVAQLEQSDEKLSSDPGFLQRLAGSDGLFLPGSVGLTLSRRIS
jgi:hypothetical protein